MQWSDRIGRRVKLRDLHVLLAAAQFGSLSRAAERLAISYPVVSRTISDLEHSLGVRLFDRGAAGLEPTMYGRAFLDCGTAVFDELRRGVQQIEFLSDPTVGELQIGSTQPMMAGLLSIVIDKLVSRHPRIAIQSTTEANRILRNALRERTIDVVIVPKMSSSENERLDSEFLFDDQLLVVAGLQNRWVRRRRIELAELIDEQWTLPVGDDHVSSLIENGFHSRGLALPKRIVVSDSIHLRSSLLATGRYLSILPKSMLRFGPKPLTVKTLSIAPLVETLPYEILTLKNRMLSPVAKLFIDCARDVARPLVKTRQSVRSIAKSASG
jgi:DNA-binding transcriptional LysR family regulator